MLLSFVKNNTLIKTFDSIKASFWFIPCLMLLSNLSLCTLLLFIDLYSGLEAVNWLHFLYYADPGITRDLLVTIAGSVMTVVSITFSITIVALTNASSQFGPRLIRNFMEDRSTQMVLGAFISLFVYCLILVRMTDNFANGNFLPGLTLASAMIMTLNGILLLIYFIHHVALSLQSDNIINNVFVELQNSIQQIFERQKNEENTPSSKNTTKPTVQGEALSISSQKSGYIQAINYSELVKLTQKFDTYLEVVVDPGDFVVKRMVIIKCYSKYLTEDDQQRLINCFSYGVKRTPIQDPDFAVHQLVEVALRALSPGINDSYSAITCVDKLTSIVCDLTQQTFPQGRLVDSDGIERATYKVTSFERLANVAFNQIRQYSQTCLAVRLRQLEGLIRIAEQACEQDHWTFIRQQKQMIENGLSQQNLIGLDKKEANEQLTILNKLLESEYD